MAAIGEGVSLRSFYDENWCFTWNISGAATRADVGKLVTQDLTAKNTAKLAGDGLEPLGVLGSFENRVQEGIVVGTVNHKGVFPVPYQGSMALGDCVVGSNVPGVAKTAVAGTNNTRVVEIMAGAIAVVMFG